MGKQIVKKTVGILLAVLFVMSLTVSSVSATPWPTTCSTCGCNHVCNSGCGCGCVAKTCSICGCNHVCGPNCGCGCSGCNKCCDTTPTWQEFFNAFKNDGFECWSGLNDGVWDGLDDNVLGASWLL